MFIRTLIFSGTDCEDPLFQQCQKALNCYVSDECLTAGVFPDSTSESEYFVCVSDGVSGFIKLKFTCPEDEYFDKGSLQCLPKELTMDPLDPTKTSYLPPVGATNYTTVSITSSTDETSSIPTDFTSLPPTDNQTTTESSSATETSMVTESTTGLPSDIQSTTESLPANETSIVTESTSEISPDIQSTTEFLPADETPSDSSSTIFTLTTQETTLPNSDATSSTWETSTDTSSPTDPFPTSETPFSTESSVYPTASEATPGTTISESTTFNPSSTQSFPTVSSELPSPTSTSTDSSISTVTSTSLTSASTPSSPFECTTAGLFPDPLNCKVYFRCSTSLKQFTYTCPGISYFNENLLKCSLVVTPTCQEQILMNEATVPTETPFESSTVTPVTLVTTLKSPAPSVQSFPTSTQATTTTSKNLFICPAPGIFADPSNCKLYYRCSTALSPFVYVCPGKSYFNELLKKCSTVVTPDCQSQILNNSTTTLITTDLTSPDVTLVSTTEPITMGKASFATTTLISTTTFLPPTLPPSTTTHKILFSCQTFGVFPNPDNCRTYYRCSKSGKGFMYKCPQNLYYNEFEKKCGAIKTERCKLLEV